MTVPIPNEVFLTSPGAFLPGDPVGNDLIEDRLGLVAGVPSRYRDKVLAANGIATRHYALDDDGNQTHLNEEMAALAITDALERRGIGLGEVSMLSVGTTVPDVLMPGFAPMVHGRLAESHPDAGPMEVLSAAGICASGAAAFKAAWTNVAMGLHDRAVAGASELASVMMKSSRFERESELAPQRSDVADGFGYFNADFLRWMLSDGAGAALLESSPHPDRPSLRVDWVELTSYAHAYPTCMFLGASDPAHPAVGNTWLSKDSAAVADEQGMMVIRQDTALLANTLLPVGCDEVRRLVKTGRIDLDRPYDWFLPHLSSYFFADLLAEGLAEGGLDLPRDRWFTNLSSRGNTGSASLYLIIEEAMAKEIFRPGDRILAMVPESGRFTMSFMQFTCVAP